jgi:hypothetical protein
VLITVSESTCECNFHSCMSLPCRHIFFFRKHKNMSSFDQCLVDHDGSTLITRKTTADWDGDETGRWTYRTQLWLSVVSQDEHVCICSVLTKHRHIVDEVWWITHNILLRMCLALWQSNIKKWVKLVTVVTFTRMQLPFQLNR